MSDAKEPTKNWVEMGGGEPRHPEFATHQAENLLKIRDMLEQVVAQKQAEVQALKEKLVRMRRQGGGA